MAASDQISGPEQEGPEVQQMRTARNKPVKLPPPRQEKAAPLQSRSLHIPAATSQVDYGSKMNFSSPRLNTGLVLLLSLGSKVVERLRKSLLHCTGFLSSKPIRLQQIHGRVALCISPLAGKSVFGESQHSHSPFVELVSCVSAVPSADLRIVSKITRKLFCSCFLLVAATAEGNVV